MSDLQIGRVGLDVTFDTPERWTMSAGQLRTERIDGELRSTTSLAETKALRTELLAQVGHLVPVVSDDDALLSGIYILDDATVDLDALMGPFNDVGFARFSVTLTRIGSYSEVEFQSLLSMVDAAEDHATTASFWHSPPVGTRAYSAGAAAPTLIERDTEDGDILFAYDIPEGTHPTWSVDPADYYKGAVELWADDRLRAGRDMPMDPADWYITNGLMQVRPGATTGSSNGLIEVRFWDGTAWDSWIGFSVRYDNTSAITAWHFVSVLRNDAEAVGVRLVRDAQEDSETTAKHELDLVLRRGGAFVSCVYKFDGAAQNHGVRRSTTDAATRPGGTASYVADADTIDGHKWILGCPKAFTEDETNGGLALTSTSQSMPFFIGAAIGNASNGTGNGLADLAEQYVGQVAESVRAVRR